MRALACGLVILLAGGCASGRTAGKVVLGALVVGGAALAIGAAVKSNSIEKNLNDDYRGQTITGMQFADRDSDGQRWNRIGRAAAFVGGLSLLGLGVIWEMQLADKAQSEPAKADLGPLLPLPGRQSSVGNGAGSAIR
jgi:hypothetical protein